jgi:hypothetical protein
VGGVAKGNSHMTNKCDTSGVGGEVATLATTIADWFQSGAGLSTDRD